MCTCTMPRYSWYMNCVYMNTRTSISYLMCVHWHVRWSNISTYDEYDLHYIHFPSIFGFVEKGKLDLLVSYTTNEANEAVTKKDTMCVSVVIVCKPQVGMVVLVLDWCINR